MEHSNNMSCTGCMFFFPKVKEEERTRIDDGCMIRIRVENGECLKINRTVHSVEGDIKDTIFPVRRLECLVYKLKMKVWSETQKN